MPRIITWGDKVADACKLRPNKAEIKLGDILDKYFPNQWKYVGDGQLVVAGKIPDFTNINGKKQLIELFGDYWHRSDNPQKRIDIFKQYGYSTVVIWERELKDESGIVDKVKGFSSVETFTRHNLNKVEEKVQSSVKAEIM